MQHVQSQVRRSRAVWLTWCLLLVTVFVVFNRPAAALNESNFLPPEKAFAIAAQMVEPNTLQVSYRIAPGYYMYHEQFAFTSEPAGLLGEPALPAGKVIYDLTFEKDLETHRDSIAIRIPLVQAPQPFTVLATSQGCADAGLCYPPMTQHVKLTPGSDGAWQVVPASLAGAAGGSGTAGGLGAWLTANDVGLADALTGAALWQTAGVFFLLGVLLSLTPCVLPMLPILSSILVGDSAARGQQTSRLRGLGLAATYVLGMSLVYTAAGVAAGLTGASLAATLQTPWVLAIFATLLVVFALAMFDVFTVQVPAGAQARLATWSNRLPGGRYTGAFGMGAISALIVGPCVAAPLAGALLYISQSGDVWLGALALFALAWGMGVTLLLAGASAGVLLPKAGPWMDGVKRFFGMLLLAVAWWMLLPVLPGWVQMAGWAVLALFAASLLHAFDPLPADAATGRRLAKGAGWVFAIIGLVEVVGVASGGRDPLQPLAHFAPLRSNAPVVATRGWGPQLNPQQGGYRQPGSATGSFNDATGSSNGAADFANGASDFANGAAGSLDGADVAGFSGSAASGVASTQSFAETVAGMGGKSQPLNGLASNGAAARALNDRNDSAGVALRAGNGAGTGAGAGANTGAGASVVAARGFTGASDANRGTQFVQVASLAELDAVVGQAGGRPVMLDFYADWCVSCKEMEMFTFSDPIVAQRMAQMVLVQADVTANNDEHRALLKRFRLFGPPGIIFFDAQGQERTDTRVIGFQNARRFGAVLEQVLTGL